MRRIRCANEKIASYQLVPNGAQIPALAFYSLVRWCILWIHHFRHYKLWLSGRWREVWKRGQPQTRPDNTIWYSLYPISLLPRPNVKSFFSLMDTLTCFSHYSPSSWDEISSSDVRNKNSNPIFGYLEIIIRWSSVPYHMIHMRKMIEL